MKTCTERNPFPLEITSYDGLSLLPTTIRVVFPSLFLHVLYSQHVSSPRTADLWTTQVWTAQVWIHLHLDFFFFFFSKYVLSIGDWLNSQMPNCGYWEESWILNLSICGAARAGNGFESAPTAVPSHSSCSVYVYWTSLLPPPNPAMSNYLLLFIR